jgi:photosystem II stability/assembly factor-like uncharacterized protein
MKYTMLYFSFIVLSIIIYSKSHISILKKQCMQGMQPDELYWQSRYYTSDETNPELLMQAYQKLFSEMKNKKTRGANNWQIEGPNNIGGRVNTLAIHPTDTNTILIGMPHGGIYRSVDGGSNWNPVFDNQTTQNISVIVFDKNNPNTVYAGTGDGPLAGDARMGNGVYRSIDAGITWTYFGLKQVQTITKIIIDPANANHILVSGMGNPFTKDINRGIYETTTGGATWNQILYIDSTIGIADMIINPQNAKTIFATSRYRSRSDKHSIVSGPKTKIFKTINGGQTWDTLSGGLPSGSQTRIGLAMSMQDTNKIYANYVNALNGSNFGGVWRTLNGGTSWTRRCPDSAIAMNGFGWYFGEIKVNPINDEMIYVLSVDLWRSTNGGQTFSLNAPIWYTYNVHADKHDLQFIDANTYYLTTDGGIYKTNNSGVNWIPKNKLPITEFYKVAYNTFEPTLYNGGAQDNGTSNGNATNANNWNRQFGGDGFQAYYDSLDINIAWVETQNGNIFVTTNGGGNYSNISNTITNTDRTNWSTPYIIDQSNVETMYMGTYRLYQNIFNLSNSWQAISPDLTDGPQNVNDSGFHTITTVAQNNFNANTLYVGTSDENVWVTTNLGSTWLQINTGLPNRYVTCVEASKAHDQTLYVSCSGYRLNDSTSYLYKSIDNGNTWVSIANNLPALPINNIYIHPNTHDSNMVVATDGGVYVTTTAGASWKRLGDNMPVIPVLDIDYNPSTQRLFVGTYARSMQSMAIDSVFKLEKANGNVGLLPVNKNIDVNIFPIPANNILFIECANSYGKHYQIYNTLGNIVYTNIYTNKQSIDLSKWSGGLYVFAFKNEAIENAKPFTIVH